jgi:hypothetical protein
MLTSPFFVLLKIGNLFLRAGSEFKGFAGRDCELLWSTRVYEILNSKHEISRCQVSGVRCQEKNIEPETLVIVICDLAFLATLADFRKRGKSIQAPSGVSPKPGPSPNSGIFDGPGFFTLYAQPIQSQRV